MTAGQALPPGWRLRIYESIGSTNTLLRQLAEAGEPEGVCILARRQTGGRGRDGRVWESPAGNLYLSVLLRPDGPARDLGQWGLLSAVALAESLAGFTVDPDSIRLKWPNDLLLHEAKLAGILCESAMLANGRIDWLIFGMGVNLAVAPALPDRGSACLGPLDIEAVAQSVMDSVHRWRGIWQDHGFAPIRAAWAARGPVPDVPLLLRGGLAGRYAGLDENGNLLLAAEGRVHALTSGEIGGAGGP